MVHSVFELGDTLVREVMVPRTDLVTIERFKTIRQALTLALRSGFSRIPVTGESEDDIVGIVYLKDLVRKTHISREAESDLVSTAMRPAVFVPDTKNAGDLLREMQKERNHVAVVIDEYGGTAGIVTIEDILEEIVGEITDEYDRELPPVVDLGDDRYRVTARLDITDLGELYGLEEYDDEDVETVGGLLAKALARAHRGRVRAGRTPRRAAAEADRGGVGRPPEQDRHGAGGTRRVRRGGEARVTPQELRAFCLSFNAAVEDFPFDTQTSVFKVLGKMFALTNLARGPDGQPQVRSGGRGTAARRPRGPDRSRLAHEQAALEHRHRRRRPAGPAAAGAGRGLLRPRRGGAAQGAAAAAGPAVTTLPGAVVLREHPVHDDAIPAPPAPR